MTDECEQNDVELRVVRALNQSVHGLPEAQARELLQRRGEALLRARNRSRAGSWLNAGAALLAAGLAAWVIWPSAPVSSTVPVSVAAPEDMSLAADQVDFEMLDNLDFYDWLARDRQPTG